MTDLSPPRPLSITARANFDRHAARIYREGRWSAIDHDALATYCETQQIYLQCKEAVDAHGVLMQGRTATDLVKNPALTPMNQARAAMVVLARAVPLTTGKVDRSELDREIDEILRESM